MKFRHAIDLLAFCVVSAIFASLVIGEVVMVAAIAYLAWLIFK